MARMANLSVMGLYEWDNTLFDFFQIPSALNKETLINNLMAETAELETLYPNPVVLKNLIGVWSRKNIEVWNRLYATTQYEYNPIENYNRMETGTDNGTGTTSHSGTDTRTRNKADGGTETANGTHQISSGGEDSVTGTDTKGHWVAGFDSTASGQNDGLVKQTRDQDDGTTTTEYGRTENGTNSNQTIFGKTEKETENLTRGETITDSKNGSHTLHAHGNIGVTTTQEMIREQRQIETFNLYDIIIEDFKMRFCILVY